MNELLDIELTKTYRDTRPIGNYITEEVSSCRSSHEYLSNNGSEMKDKNGEIFAHNFLTQPNNFLTPKHNNRATFMSTKRTSAPQNAMNFTIGRNTSMNLDSTAT